MLPQVDVTVGGQTQPGGNLIKWKGFLLNLLLNCRFPGSLRESCQ